MIAKHPRLPSMDTLDWFNGNKDALDLYERLSFVSHAIDDLIDRDKEVPPEKVAKLTENLLLHIPGNPFYRKHEAEMRGFMFIGLSAYKAANLMEKSGDSHKIELAHYARYVVANAAIFMITVAHGMEKAPEIVAEALPVMVSERLADFVKEHTHELAS